MSHALLGSLREILGHVALATGRAGSLLLSWHEGELSLNEKPFSKGPGASGISGPDQPTPQQELPAAALTAFAATPPAVPFPLPPGPEYLGGKLRTLFFFDEAAAKNFWPGAADSAAGTSCGQLITAVAATPPAAPFPLPPGPENLGGKLRTLNFFLTRPPPGFSGPDQPTPRQELPAAALTAFAATPPAARFPLPPVPENLGGKLRTLNFFVDEAAAKTFWPGSADAAPKNSQEKGVGAAFAFFWLFSASKTYHQSRSQSAQAPVEFL